jgi:hypothetical protein
MRGRPHPTEYWAALADSELLVDDSHSSYAVDLARVVVERPQDAMKRCCTLS